MAKIIECPHCHESVMPGPDRHCPACRADTSDLEGIDASTTTVTLREGEPPPRCCITCGQYTDRVRTIRDTWGSEGASLLVRIAAAMYQFPWPGRFERPTVRVVTARVPECEACASGEKIRPLHVDFENHRMKFLAHRSFRQALERHRHRS